MCKCQIDFKGLTIAPMLHSDVQYLKKETESIPYCI